MKQIGHYFPFFVLTILLYGWFFYHHKQATIITAVPLNSGQQAVQLQLLEMKGVTEETADEVKAESQVKTESEVKAENEVKAAPANLPGIDPDAQTQSQIKIASQTTQQEPHASSDAMLKAELFEADFHLDLPAPPAIQSAAQNKLADEAAVESKKVKTMLSAAPSVVSEILQTQEKPKPVFKKQPQASATSISEQGVLQEAIVVSGNKPVYPKRAILRNQQGRVIVKLTVTTKGKSTDAQILSSSGHKVLDDAVLDFVHDELFMPAHQGEEKITTEQVFSFRFELN